jgi:hypothetical protein
MQYIRRSSRTIIRECIYYNRFNHVKFWNYISFNYNHCRKYGCVRINFYFIFNAYIIYFIATGVQDVEGATGVEGATIFL